MAFVVGALVKATSATGLDSIVPEDVVTADLTEDYANTDFETGGDVDSAKIATIVNLLTAKVNSLVTAAQNMGIVTDS